MSDLGTIAIALGLGLAVYSVVGSVLGLKLGSPELLASGRRAAYMTAPVSAIAVAALVVAFVTHDFSIEYVYRNSNLAMDHAFTWVAMYAGNAGSLLYIAFALAVMSAISIRLSPARFARSLPYSIAIMMGVLAFFLGTMLLFANPFAPLGFTASDGLGINPLLKHPGMFSHPPMLMAGLVGITVPYAFAAGALLSGNLRDDWVDIARVAALLIWAVLGVGLLLGAWWAYTILGWGGYWSWDPIENVALMPWLVLTAFVHSIMVQKRRGMFRMWNIALLNIAFVLSMLGMFINRGGPVVSVHSFAASDMGFVLLGFMLFCAAFSFGIFFWRYSALKSDRPLESFLSREAAFLVNNFLLLGVTFATLWGVVFPVFSELAQGVTVSVGAPFFDRVNGPMLLGLIILMGIGPLLPWRRGNVRSLRRWLLIPAIVGASISATLLLLGLHTPIAVFSFGIIAFVAAVIGGEWYRGTAARRRRGEGWLIAYWRLINGNRPRHGGYVVHISILVLALGVVGTSFYDQRTDVVLTPGDSAVLGSYRIEFMNTGTEERSDRTARWANLDVYRIDPAIYAVDPNGWRTGDRTFRTDGDHYPGDRHIGALQPWFGFYPDFQMASVRAGIRSTPVEDLYVVPSDFLEEDRVLMRMSINPLAWWLWVAGPIFVLGSVISLWPQPGLERQSVPARTTREHVSSAAAGVPPALDASPEGAD